ncbi:MAG: hypothetical protein UW39_C0014G0021 [Parcubacteria group bacterium GW2011_GWC2_44_17]|nr:MAG: hypothetical protein UW39_C0014G0021 [Parcubacteria group bacterium GW2011_GWC2_44_17]
MLKTILLIIFFAEIIAAIIVDRIFHKRLRELENK